MLKKLIACGVVILGLATADAVSAADADKGTTKNIPRWAEEFKEIAEKGSPADVDWEKESKLGKGNILVFFDQKGNPEVYIIGRASISSTMDSVDAEEDAAEDAEFSAKEAFALWLSERFTVKNERDRKVLTVRKGSHKENNKSGVLEEREEKTESVTIKKQHAEQMASGSWRGMRVYTAKRTKDEYIVVWRWSLTEQKLAKMVKIFTQDGDAGSGDGDAGSGKRSIQTFDWIKR